MMEKIKVYTVPFCILFFFLLLDGLVNAQFKSFLTFGQAEMTLRTLFVAFYIISLRLTNKHSLSLAILFGLLVDSYYTSILGIHLSAYIIVYLLNKYLKERAKLNILNIGFLGLFIYLFYASFIYYLSYWLGFSSISYGGFFFLHFIPSLALNAIVYFMIYQALQSVMDWLAIPPMDKLEI